MMADRRAAAHDAGITSALGEHGDESAMIVERPLVAVIDDDESVRESLPDLLRELGFAGLAFSSAEAFLASDCVHETKCLVLDILMPGGMSGPDLRRELTPPRPQIPTVFITAYRAEAARQSV